MTTIIDQFNAPNSTFNTAGRDIHQQNITYNITNIESAGSSSRPILSPPSAFNDAPVDLLSIHFTGRERELGLIADTFSRLRGDTPLRCVLFGDQGVGKSQLTYKWAKSTFAQRANTYVVWMSATTVEKLDQGFTKILHLTNHPDRSHSEQTIRLTAARRWLEEMHSCNWLLVLDNVFPEVLGFLREHLPRHNGRGSILCTTRTRDVAIALASAAGDRHEIVQVPMLNTKDGVELFLGHFQEGEIEASSAPVEGIVNSVGCLPLAISHAAAYMKQTRLTVDEMLALYQGKNRIHVISWQNSLSDYEHKSVTATFENQLEDLEKNCPNASNLLKMLAYFDPESIPIDMLVSGPPSALPSHNTSSPHSPPHVPRKSLSIVQKIKSKILHRGDKQWKSGVEEANTIPPQSDELLTVLQSPIELRNAITELQSRCLTAFQDNSRSTLRIHDLIQLIVLEKMKNHATEQQRWFNYAVDVACRAFKQIEDCGSPTSWPQCAALVPHIQSLTIRQSISSEAKVELLDVNSRYGFYLRSRGRYGEAEQLLVRVMADEEQLFGSEDWRTLATMYRLAVVYQEQGRVVDAETLLKRVLQTEERSLGSEHVETLNTKHRLASVYRSQERYAESEELFKKVLKTREKHLGLDHIDTLDTKMMLANVYYYQKDYREAETLYKEVLCSMEKRLGPDHLDTATIMNNLALLYGAQGHYSDAEEQLKQVLKIWEKQLGFNHPNTLIAKNNLAEVYESQGRYKDAEELFVHVLEHREEVLGPSHPRTRLTAGLLASVYEKLGCFDDAARVRRRADELH